MYYKIMTIISVALVVFIVMFFNIMGEVVVEMENNNEHHLIKEELIKRSWRKFCD